MKLLYCPICNSIFNLHPYYSECPCGNAKGMYITVEAAIYSGDGVICLAIDNGLLQRAALNDTNDDPINRTFFGWVVIPDTRHFNRVTEEDMLRLKTIEPFRKEDQAWKIE